MKSPLLLKESLYFQTIIEKYKIFPALGVIRQFKDEYN